ncbi:hypothetical protein DVW12_11285 [Clostridium botulinum]|nr:hypothetical protein [Clostridium botulinum]
MDYDSIEEILKEIKKRIQYYFDNSKSYRGIYISDINKDFIEMKNKEDRVSVKIIFNELFQKYEINTDKYKNILDRLDQWRIEESFWSFSADNCFYDKKNALLETWMNKLSSYEDRLIIGFYNKRGKKAEFIMEESRNIYEDKEGNVPNVNLLLEFEIGSVKIKISNPTPMFKLIFRVWINADFDGWWDYFETIQIEGGSRENLNKYLQQSIFINNIYNVTMNENIIRFGVKTNLRHYSNYYNYDNSNIRLKFPETKYEKPLAFYNEAFNGTKETAFLYYYKVLEFFFYISKNGGVEYKCEESCLKRVLKELNENDNVKDIIENYFSSYLLEDDDKNNLNCNNMSVEIFAKKLYKYRNSVAHGKDDRNLLSHVPMNLIDNSENKKLRGWNIIAERLSFLCIKYFCFDNFEFPYINN